MHKTRSTIRDPRIIQNQFRFLVMGSQLLENTERFVNYCYFLKQIYSWKASGQTMLLWRVCSLTWSCSFPADMQRSSVICKVIDTVMMCVFARHFGHLLAPFLNRHNLPIIASLQLLLFSEIEEISRIPT